MPLLRSFFYDTRGTTMIEYAVIAAGISIAIVAGATSIGTRITHLFLNPVAAGLS